MGFFLLTEGQVPVTKLAENQPIVTGTCPSVSILSGKYEKVWECHIEPDWLLLWIQDDKVLTLLLVDTGSHSDLF